MEKTIVVFRKFKDDGAIIALMPAAIANHAGDCMSYMHIGQHCAADYTHCIAATVPAKFSEYRKLKRELNMIGYSLTVKTRYTRKRK